ncbi:MAG: GreA/GreB family elongation factor [Myxococcaceae bacterium]
MDKIVLIQQLGEKLRLAAQQTHRASEEARADARSGAARAVNIARAQLQRSMAAREALDALDALRTQALRRGEAIGLGAVVEVENETGGRTLFIAPVGAGEELVAPGGDGFFQVVTPASPFGKALIGRRVGDDIQVTLGGEPTDWRITFAT